MTIKMLEYKRNITQIFRAERYLLIQQVKEYIKKKRMLYWQNKVKQDLKGLKSKYRLSHSQKKEIRDYYSPYIKCSTMFHEFYYASTGRFDVRYIPDDIYYAYIDPHFNNWDEAVYIDNKCYYGAIFPDVIQPITVALRCGGIWYNNRRERVDFRDALDLCKGVGKEVFLKKATESEGGHGVYVIDSEAYLRRTVEEIKGDIIIQEPLKQHEILSKLAPSSVNTIRIISLLTDEGVKIYSSVLRMGVNGARVDNASSGGITCGINENGRLKSNAYSSTGRRYKQHPSAGVTFDSIVIPNYKEAVELVKRIHLRIPHFKLTSWDIAIRDDGEPVLIEMNVHYGELDFHQLNNGPLFGEDTQKILSEVFKNKQQ